MTERVTNVLPAPLTDEPHAHCMLRAQATLERGRYSWFWIVPECPYCGKLHDHYGGPLNGDPHRYLGRRFPARCDQTDRRQLAINYATTALWYVLDELPLPEA